MGVPELKGTWKGKHHIKGAADVFLVLFLMLCLFFTGIMKCLSV